MKRIILPIVAILIAICSFGQNNSQTNGEISTGNTALINPNTVQFPRMASIATYRSDLSQKYEGEYTADKCATYRHMKIAGIVLSAVGGGMIITGAVVAGTANAANIDGRIAPSDYYIQTSAGGAMSGVGVLCLGAGIPLAIVGAVKTHRYCGLGRASLNLHSGNNGTGLAVNF